MFDRLIRLYPARWRERYGDELRQLVRDLHPARPAWALAADLVKGAFDAHLHERLTMQAADRRAVQRAALIAGIVWLGLSVEIVLTNVVFPTRRDNDTISVLVSYLCVFAALFVVGLVAARAGAGRRAQVLAGLIAGVMIGALTVATFTVVDNVWLDIVARQQAKIDGFARSGATSMRAYINHGLIGAAVTLTAGLGVFGAALGLAGGLAGERPAPSRAEPAGTGS